MEPRKKKSVTTEEAIEHVLQQEPKNDIEKKVREKLLSIYGFDFKEEVKVEDFVEQVNDIVEDQASNQEGTSNKVFPVETEFVKKKKKEF